MILLGLMGYMGSGKDAVARILEQDFGFTIFRFSGPLKDMLRAIGLTERHISGDLKEVPCDLLCGSTPRHAMQTLGTEWRELIHRDLWSQIAKRRIEASGAARIVFADCRFQHEANMLRSLGGHLWRIYRPGATISGHVSEREMDGIADDQALVNNGTLADLRESVAAVVQETGILFENAQHLVRQ